MMNHRHVLARFLALALLLTSVVSSAMPPSRMGPTWGNHNRAVHEGPLVHALAPTPTNGLVPIVSGEAAIAPLPGSAKLLEEIVSPSSSTAMRVVIDRESSAPGVYVTSGVTTRVTPIEVRGPPRADAGFGNEFIARATYADIRLHPRERPPEGLILDYDAGQLLIVRKGETAVTTPQTLPNFVHVLKEPDLTRARMATR